MRGLSDVAAAVGSVRTVVTVDGAGNSISWNDWLSGVGDDDPGSSRRPDDTALIFLLVGNHRSPQGDRTHRRQPRPCPRHHVSPARSRHRLRGYVPGSGSSMWPDWVSPWSRRSAVALYCSKPSPDLSNSSR